MKAGSGASWLVGITLLSLVGGLIIYSYTDWPGSRYFGIADKKFWDYLDLLIVPAALAIGVYWLNRAQQEREREADEAQQRRERKAEEDRRDRERTAEAAQRAHELEVENQRAQDAALQAYFDQMSQLLVDKERPLRQSVEGDEVRTLGRSRTLTVLPGLDGDRKRSVVQFLYESRLIGSAEGEKAVVSLRGADLRGADLSGINLGGAVLRRAYLQTANLTRASLVRANLSKADLSNSDLRFAELHSVDLSHVHLSNAKLNNADLRNANLTNADLYQADLSWGSLFELNEMSKTLRTIAVSTMEGAAFPETDLRGANLTEASLTDADLRRANLSTATVDWGELDHAASLEGATMPNGQKYEDLLKDKESHGEDE